MRHRWLIVALLFVAAGCGDRDRGPAGTPGPPEYALRGHTFVDGELTVDGKPHQLVDGTEVTVEFTDDGRLIAQAGCNMMQAPVDTADKKLTFDGGIESTAAGCDKASHEQDGLIAEVLSATPTWRLSESKLEIVSGTTTLTLTDRSVADPDRPLEGTEWTLDTLVDGQVASSVPRTVAPVRVTFDGEEVSASTGCNGAGGRYTVDGDTLHVTPGARTLMACADDIMRVESAVQNVLDGDVRFAITADRLTLTNPSGKEIQLRAS